MGKSKHVISILLGFLAGVYLGDLFNFSFFWLLGVVFGLVIVLCFFWKSFFWRIVLFGLIGLVLGFTLISFWKIRISKINISYDQNMEFQACVIDYPVYSKDKATYLVGYKKAKIQLQTARYPEYSYGDCLQIKGQIKLPSQYLLKHNILGQINSTEIQKVGWRGNRVYRVLFFVRDRFEKIINKIFSEPFASFAAGLILGSKRNIADSLMEDFNRTGTTHIIAVSGYNVSILVIYAGLLLGMISYRLKFWGSLLVILIFVTITGATASVVRAGILAALIVFGKNAGRRINLNILILLVATSMVLFNPYLLKYDVSFQLSFGAFCGLVYISPVLSKKLLFLPIKIRQMLSETLAAQIMVLPILIYYFGQASLISPLVNILILWLVPLAMFLVFLSALAGLASVGFGQLIGVGSVLPLKYIIFLVKNFSQISWSSLQIKTDSWWWMLPYFLGLGLIVYAGRTKVKTDEEAY